MNIVGLFPMRNEMWCAGLTLRAALLWMDSIIVLDHASTDGSRELALEIGEETKRITVICEDNPVWHEMRHRQMMLDTARQLKATHLGLVDCDEILSANLLPHIRSMFEALPNGRILQLPWLCLRGGLDKVHISGPWADGQNVTTGFVDSPELYWSSAGRGGYDFHNRAPMGRQMVPYLPIQRDRNAGLIHLQFVNQRRLAYKQLQYCLIERSRWPNREPVEAVRKRYSLAVYGSHDGPDPHMEETLGPALQEPWWGAYKDLMQHFHPDAEPWQAENCRKMLRENPGIEKGLDDFGTGLFSSETEAKMR